MRFAAPFALAALLSLAASPAARAAGPDRDEPMDEAIDRGLRFLDNAQNPDGSWPAGRSRRDPAITALAVMAFMSAGHVPGEGEYGETVAKGIRFVMESQRPNGLFAHNSFGPYEMYCHGICTLALAEAAGMTRGDVADELRRSLEKAVGVILTAQRTSGQNRGGWRYRVQGNDADISVTGWQVMALRAAKNVGCDVPAERIRLAVEYIQRCRDAYSGGYRYTIGSGVTVPCTGTSILALELCGKEYHRSPEALKAGGYLLKHRLQVNGPHFFYGVYYTSQAMFQLGDNYWESYRPVLHRLLLRDNAPAANGAWSGRGWDDQTFGPTYCTAMAILALTVEYRYLPIYQRSEEPVEEAAP
ncbi:MAG TPA: prenyltransferase/squalene oxidase repeat-containing protein [Gemmataceae bacterium]